MPLISDFEWDDTKDRLNRTKHGFGFAQAQRAFLDPRRVVAEDLEHSQDEQRISVSAKWRAARHGEVHDAWRQDQDLRRRLLAQGKGDQ